METHHYFIQIALILLTARIFGEFASRIQIPSVLGELFAGVLLGPSLLGLVPINDIIRLLAEIGLILMLFEVGLETDLSRMVKAGPKALIVALNGFFAPFVLGFIVSYFIFGYTELVSMFIAGTLTATSIGITVRILKDVHRQHHTEAQIILGAAVIDDILGVILLALIYEFSLNGGINWLNASKVIIYIGLFFVLAPIVAKLISLAIKHFDRHSATPGLIPSAVISLVLLFSWLAHEIGAPELLGGFAAGLALSRRFFLPFGIALHSDPHYSTNIHSQISPIVRLFTPVFFVSIGLSMNLSEIDWGQTGLWTFTFSLLAVAILGKLSGALALKEPLHIKIAIGAAMVPRGEVGLIFAELGHLSGILSNSVHAALIVVIAITTLITPLFLKRFYQYLPNYEHPHPVKDRYNNK